MPRLQCCVSFPGVVTPIGGVLLRQVAGVTGLNYSQFQCVGL
ncbi:hypothetical protein O9993_12105 [Vibrio lentus]|nr:hypothetical protein [Vibrio lentus]